MVTDGQKVGEQLDAIPFTYGRLPDTDNEGNVAAEVGLLAPAVPPRVALRARELSRRLIVHQSQAGH